MVYHHNKGFYGMVKSELLGPEEFSFGTGTGQCRHKTAVLKRTRWQVVLQ